MVMSVMPPQGGGRRIRRRAAGSVLAAAALLVSPVAARAAPLQFVDAVMTGLLNPRGLAFGPDGALYVAEAGSGGSGTEITSGAGQPVRYGQTGGISRYQNGVQERVVSGLPSLAGPDGAGADGVQDLAFDADGTLHALIGLGADPALRDGALSGDAGSALLGTLVSIESGAPALVADLAAFEAANDPDGGVPDSNPFGLVAQGNGFLAADAGGNDVLAIDGMGAITLKAVLPPSANPLFPGLGGPTYQAVPTGAALGPDGDLFLGQLTGFPFLEGAAQIFSLQGEALSVVAGGLTHIIDVAFGADGTLFALEFDSNGLLNEGSNGALYSIGLDGSSKLLFDDLVNPTGLAIGTNGDLFVSNNGLSPGEGSVVQLAPVPLPAALPVMASGLVLLAGWRLRAGSSRKGRLLG